MTVVLNMCYTLERYSWTWCSEGIRYLLCFDRDETSYIQISEFHISQSLDYPITQKDTAIIAGAVSSRDGYGSGNFSVGYRRQTSDKGWLEVCSFIKYPSPKISPCGNFMLFDEIHLKGKHLWTMLFYFLGTGCFWSTDVIWITGL